MKIFPLVENWIFDKVLLYFFAVSVYIEIPVFPVRRICLNIEPFLMKILSSVHVVISEEDDLALLAPFFRNKPFA